MSSKDIVTPIVVFGENYYVHAQIKGAFWTGYVVYENEYLMSLPSCTHMIGLIDAAERLLEARKQKGEFQVH